MEFLTHQKTWIVETLSNKYTKIINSTRLHQTQITVIPKSKGFSGATYINKLTNSVGQIYGLICIKKIQIANLNLEGGREKGSRERPEGGGEEEKEMEDIIVQHTYSALEGESNGITFQPKYEKSINVHEEHSQAPKEILRNAK